MQGHDHTSRKQADDKRGQFCKSFPAQAGCTQTCDIRALQGHAAQLELLHPAQQPQVPQHKAVQLAPVGPVVVPRLAMMTRP